MSKHTKQQHALLESIAGRSVPVWRFVLAYLMVIVAYLGGRSIQAGHHVVTSAGYETGAWSAFWWISFAMIAVPLWTFWLVLIGHVRQPRWAS